MHKECRGRLRRNQCGKKYQHLHVPNHLITVWTLAKAPGYRYRRVMGALGRTARAIVVVLTWRFHEVGVVAVQTPLHPCRGSYAALSSHQRVHNGEEVVHVAAHDPHQVGDSGQDVSLLLKHGGCFMTEPTVQSTRFRIFEMASDKIKRSKHAT